MTETFCDRVALRADAASGVAELRLVRADRHNAIDMAMVEGLAAATDALRGLDGVRAVLVCADGPSFSVGGDLPYIDARDEPLGQILHEMIGPYHETLAQIAELEVPVVAAVGGPAAGGGLGLLWAADIVIAADDLKLATGFAKLGVTGDGGSSWYLPRLVGLRRAQELILESPVLDAHTALADGLVTRVVARDALADEADATVRRLAAGPTVGLALQRRLLRDAADRSLREGLAAELEAMGTSGASDDAPEGFAAFVARRAPAFRGT